LGHLHVYRSPDVLVGYETADDAGVFRLDSERALVQTLDFFTPVVDDPYLYGAIAAANSLSDVYAMGGRPITALAIACFPETGIDMQVLTQIMSGGLEKLREADVALLGGHTVADKEIKFGYSVTGLIHPRNIITNSGALPGDSLVLTKPLGIGLLTSGIKFRKTSPATEKETVRVMTTLNRAASETMIRHECHAATDITGNGLLGHAFEMAEASRVTLRFYSEKIPIIAEAYDLAKTRLLPKTIASTWKLIGEKTELSPRLSEPWKNIILDPQTSGGLLIALGHDRLQALLDDMAQAGVDAREIGRVENRQEVSLRIE
jgi:selenide,water dikinase